MAWIRSDPEKRFIFPSRKNVAYLSALENQQNCARYGINSSFIGRNKHECKRYLPRKTGNVRLYPPFFSTLLLDTSFSLWFFLKSWNFPLLEQNWESSTQFSGNLVLFQLHWWWVLLRDAQFVLLTHCRDPIKYLRNNRIIACLPNGWPRSSAQLLPPTFT